MKILVVDDSEIFRVGLKKILLNLGYKDIIEAEDGRQGLMKLSTDSIDLVFLDWEMPYVSGIQMLNAVRSSAANHDIPVIMCTSHSRKKDIVQAVKAGVNAYLVKPLKKEAIKKKLEEMGFARG